MSRFSFPLNGAPHNIAFIFSRLSESVIHLAFSSSRAFLVDVYSVISSMSQACSTSHRRPSSSFSRFSMASIFASHPSTSLSAFLIRFCISFLSCYLMPDSLSWSLFFALSVAVCSLFFWLGMNNWSIESTSWWRRKS